MNVETYEERKPSAALAEGFCPFGHGQLEPRQFGGLCQGCATQCGVDEVAWRWTSARASAGIILWGVRAGPHEAVWSLLAEAEGLLPDAFHHSVKQIALGS